MEFGRWTIGMLTAGSFKDRHQWLGREFRCSLLISMDKLFPKDILCIIYH